MIIEGTIHEGTSAPESFVFRSRDNEKQRRFFNPVLVVDESSNQITVVFEFKGTNWFIAEDRSLLDPRDEYNEDEISDNLRESIEIVEKKSVKDNNNDDSY